MKFLFNILLLFSGLNIILARSIYWGPYHRDVINPWTNYDYDDELFAMPTRQDSDEEREYKEISKLFNKSIEDSKEKTEPKTSDEHDEHDEDDDQVESLKSTQLKEIEKFLTVVMDDNESKDESNKSKDNNDDDDDDDDKTDNSQEQIPIKKTQSSLTEFASKESKETFNHHKSEEDYDDILNGIFLKQLKKTSEEKPEEHERKISEKDIRELTAILITLSTLDDLMKMAEVTADHEESLDEEELNEKKLKEVNEYLNLFGSFFDKILDESTENEKETGKPKKDDNNQSEENKSDNENEDEKDKDDDDDDDKDNNKDDDDDDKDKDKDKDNNDDDDDKDKDSNDDDDKDKNNNDDDDDDKDSKADDNDDVSLEFHSIENSGTNLNNHKYDILSSSTVAAELKPTSSPYLPKPLASNPDNNNVIQEYVEVRKKIDTLEDDLLSNTLNMDNDFYNIIANENGDNEMKKFSKDISVLREKAYQIKQTVDDLQDIKSKLYFHKLLKAALKGVQFN